MKCCKCNAKIGSGYMCDEYDGKYSTVNDPVFCDDCFEPETHCSAEHDEGCQTNVFDCN